MNKYRISILLFSALAALPVFSQDIYKVEMLANKDLTGTARFVGMGGAMNALGADISTVAYNPAGAAMFRSSGISITGGFTPNPMQTSFMI